jgi:hypothetical protein
MRLRWWVLFSTMIAVIGGGLLGYLIYTVWPDQSTIFALPQLLFFSGLFITLSSGTIPIVAYLNYRFAAPGWLQLDPVRLLRQGCWVGLLGVLLAYLQLSSALSITVVLILITIFIFVELFILSRE